MKRAWFLLIPVTIFFVYLFQEDLSTLWSLIISMDVVEIANYIRSFGPWAILISLLLSILLTLAAFLPSVFLSGANAVVFGLFWGGIISWLGEIIGAAIAFLFYRFLGRRAVTKLIEKKENLAYLDKLSSEKGFVVVLLARLAPFMPSSLVNLLGGISSISFSSFILATALGKAPSLVLETFIGHDLIFFSENQGRLAISLSIVVVFYLGLKLWQRKRGG